MTPAVGQKGVPDKDALLQARVQVESDVGPSRWPQVHAETATGSDVINEPWKAKPKLWTASCLLSLQVYERRSVMIKWRSHDSGLNLYLNKTCKLWKCFSDFNPNIIYLNLNFSLSWSVSTGSRLQVYYEVHHSQVFIVLVGTTKPKPHKHNVYCEGGY